MVIFHKILRDRDGDVSGIKLVESCKDARVGAGVKSCCLLAATNGRQGQGSGLPWLCDSSGRF